MKHNAWVSQEGESLFIEQFDDWDEDWGYDWNKNITPYFQRLNKISNERSFVIFATIVLEAQVDSFLNNLIPEPQILLNKNTSFDFKIKLLRAFNLLPPQFINFTQLIKNIRNEFAHNLQIDRFKQAKKSKELLEHLRLLDKYYLDYESEMYSFKNKATTLFKFKDIWRIALEGIHIYKRNMKLFTQETRKPEFIKQLKFLSTKLKDEREIKDKAKYRTLIRQNIHNIQ